MPSPRKYDPAKRKAAYERAKARARAEGFSSPSQRTRARRRVKLGLIPNMETYLRVVMLTRHGVTLEAFNAMRRRNLLHIPEGTGKDGRPGSFLARQIQSYRVDIDELEHDWSDARVGYIISFFWAVTAPSTNYFSIPQQERELYYFEPVPKIPPRNLQAWTDRQFTYLVRYGGFEDVDEFDSRYGDGGPLSRQILSQKV